MENFQDYSGFKNQPFVSILVTLVSVHFPLDYIVYKFHCPTYLRSPLSPAAFEGQWLATEYLSTGMFLAPVLRSLPVFLQPGSLRWFCLWVALLLFDNYLVYSSETLLNFEDVVY